MSEEHSKEGAVATHPARHEVEIFIGGKGFKVQQGTYTVAELKQLGGIPSDYDLDQLIHGKIVTLPDDGKVEIEGGEKFVGRPRSGSSS